MDPPIHRSSRTHNSVPLDDLDLQPVRELRTRILNDVYDEPVISSPKVKFNFVDVSFPKEPSGKAGSAGSIDKIKSHKKSHSKSELRNVNTHVSRRSPGTDTMFDNGSEMAKSKSHSFLNTAEDGRRQFMSQLLRKGIPLWEEVPQDELRARCIGISDTFKHQSHHTANITTRNPQRPKKSSKVPTAVWEDVMKSSASSHGVVEGEKPLESGLVCDKTQGTGSKQMSENRRQHHDSSTQLSQSAASAVTLRTSQNLKQTNPTDASHLPESNRGHGAIHSPPTPQHSEQNKPRSSEEYSTPNFPHESASVQQNPHSVHMVTSSQTTPGNIQMREHELLEQEREPRVMKRKFGGRLVDDGNVIGVKSWRIGEKAVREKFRPHSQVSVRKDDDDDDDEEDEEEEKHEKESTKEMHRKRDLSVPSQVSEQPSKRQQKFHEKEESSPAKVTKTPPRLRNYEVAEVRKFMEKKRMARSKSYREQKNQRELDKIKKEERMKELAAKTKELAQVDKITGNPGTSASLAVAYQHSTQIDSKVANPPNWGCPRDCQHEINPHNAVPNFNNEEEKRSLGLHLDSPQKKYKEKKTQNEGNKKETNKQEKNDTHKEEKDKDGMPEKRRSKDRKKKRKKSVALESSCSDTISDLVSRTVEECEKQLRSSSISVSSITSSTSLDISDSEVKSNMSLSESSSLDVSPNQRIVSLGQMAQKLTSRITEEEEKLKHFLIANKGTEVPLSHEGQQSDNKRGKAASSGFKGRDVNSSFLRSERDVAHHQLGDRSALREPLSYSQIQTLSVEELKARMTAMLLPSATRMQGRSDVTMDSAHKGEPQNEYVSDTKAKLHEGHEGKTEKYQNLSSQLKSTPEEEIPNLLIPETPELQLSAGGRVLINANFPKRQGGMEHFFNLHERSRQRSAAGNTNQEALNELPGNNIHLHSRTSVPLPFQLTGTRNFCGSHQRKVHPCNLSERNKFESAALCIQAAYRGYRVRKVTSSLLRKEHRLGNVVKSSHSSKHNKFFHEYVGECSQDENAEQRGEIDWRKIKKELEKNVYQPKRVTSYVFQRTDLPEWIKPYVILSETGNVSNFIKSRMRENNVGPVIVAENNAKDKEFISSADEIRDQDASNSDSDKENIQEVNDSLFDATLTEGLISDLEEKEDLTVFEKGTQTSLKPHRRNVKEKNDTGVKKNTADLMKNVNAREFVDMKRSLHCEKSLLLDKSKTSPRHILNEISVKPKLSFQENGNNEKQSLSRESNKSPHDETLEEGELEDTEAENVHEMSKCAIKSSYEGTDELGKANSSDILESSDVSKFVHSEEQMAPHHFLGRGPHFGPANLRLRLNAELMYQDTVNEALNQLHGVEQLHVLTKTKEKNVAIAQSLAAQQQEKMEAYNRLREDRQKQVDEEKRREDREFRRKELQIQQEALLTVERIEKEAKERLDQLEREVRTRAEQIMSNNQRPLDHTTTQPDVIATAAVAAVGATISHWERLKKVQGGGHHAGSFDSANAMIQSSQPISSSIIHSQQYTTSFSDSSNRSQSKVSRSKRSFSSSKNVSGNSRTYSSVSEKISSGSEDKSRSSVIEELSPASHSTAASSVEEFVQSEVESTKSSVSEAIKTSRTYKTTHSDSDVQELEGLATIITSGSKTCSESIKTPFSNSEEKVFAPNMNQTRLSRSKEKSPAPHFKKPKTYSDDVSEITSVAEDLKISKSISKVSEDSIPSEINGTSQSTKESRTVPSASDIKESFPSSSSRTVPSASDIKESFPSSSSRTVPSASDIKESFPSSSSRTVPSASDIKESFPSSSSRTVPSASDIKESFPSSSSRTVPSASDIKESFPSSSNISTKQSLDSQESHSAKDATGSQQSIQELLIDSKTTTVVTSTSSTHITTKQKNGSEIADTYSESFEVESMSDSSSTSAFNSQRRSVREYQGDMSLVVSGNILAAVDQMGYKGPPQVGRDFTSGLVVEGGTTTTTTALGMTLNLVESLQKEEEVRLQHQTALLKLQEQSLIEEARWKLAALQSEGGPGLRRRQRAVLLQLREQRSHLRRLIETQNLAAQQRRLLLLQHHHLLATTSSISAGNNKGYPSISRGHSPNPSSPRLTPRMMEISISSSSEGQEDLSLHLSVKSRETGSSSLSDSGSWEKRRSHSDERKRTSVRLQDKRRAVEADPLQKAKSFYDNQEKELSKTKRKIDMVSKRSRDKREKSPITTVRLPENTVSTESSVPTEESIDASTQESQSSVPEEGGSESVSQSDVASSVSEHEGSSLRNKQLDYSVASEVIESQIISPSEEILTQSQTNVSHSLSSKSITSHIQKSETSKESSKKPSSALDTNSLIKTVNSEEMSQGMDKTSIKTLLSDKSSQRTDKTDTIESNIIEANSKSSEIQSIIHTGTSGSERQSKSKSESCASEVNEELKSRMTSSRSLSKALTGSDERTSDSKSSEIKSSSQRSSSSRALPLPFRVPLSPRSPHRQHRRYSSESDDSFTLSQTETASDISDGEGKLIALKEQLASRRAEADKLRREKRRVRRERLASQEQALRQQISNYDAYIQQAKMELERESKELQQASQVRPLIKKPQVAESKKLRHSESLTISPDKSDISDISLLSEGSKSDQSATSSSKSQEGRSDHSMSCKLRVLKSDLTLPSKAQEIEAKVQAQQSLPEIGKSSEHVQISSLVESKPKDVLFTDNYKKPLSVHNQPTQEEEAESLKESRTSSISEEYSFEEESASDHSVIESTKHSLSRDSSQDTDQSPSQASSTETIVHSPKKLDSGQKEDEVSISGELSSVLSQKEESQEIKNNVEIRSDFNIEDTLKDSAKPSHDGEAEKKLEIFIPTPHTKSEADESSDHDKETSAEESIGEEIVEDIEIDAVHDTSVKDAMHDTSVKDAVHDTSVEDAVHDTSVKDAVHDTSVKDEVHDTSVKDEVHDTSVKDEVHDTSVKDEVRDTSVKDEAHDTSVKDEVHDTSVNDHSDIDLICSESFERDLLLLDNDDGQSSGIEDKSDTFSKLQSFGDKLQNSQISSQVLDAEVLQKEDEIASKGKSLSRQRQVDDISNTILATLMKETTQMFADILKEKEISNTEVPTCSGVEMDSQPTVIPSKPCSSDSKVESLKLLLGDPEVQEKQKQKEKIEKEKAEDEEMTLIKEDSNEISSEVNTSSSKSQVLKRVNDLIAESGSSPHSTSLNSPRPTSLQLTPQLTFDISPDTLSPLSPSPASPSKFPKESELGNLPDVSPALVAASEVVHGDESQGASPSHDLVKAGDYSLDMTALTNKLLNLTSSADIDLDSKLDQIEDGNAEFSVEGIEGNWFDDDFWTSADNRKKQQQLKAEEERIAAEIARLEELQRLQEQFPGLVIRDVPNKPPPPYTPPPSSSSSSSPTSSSSSPSMPPAYRPTTPPDGQLSPELQTSSSSSISMPHRLSKADLRKLATEIFHVVPSAQEEAMPIISESLDCIYKALERGIDPSSVEPPSKFLPSSTNGDHNEDSSGEEEEEEEEDEEEEESCSRIFHLLMFSLARELVSEVYNLQRAPAPPPWVKRSLPPTHMLMVVHTKSQTALFSHVQERVKVLFGWNPSSEKESLMLRWARKHRDLVDQVLVKELQAEEASWTRYDEDEAFVKLQVANEILDNLIDDTITLITNILAKKISLTKLTP